MPFVIAAENIMVVLYNHTTTTKASQYGTQMYTVNANMTRLAK